MKLKRDEVIVENVETPETGLEKEVLANNDSEQNYRKFAITREDICIASVLISIGFLFLLKFLFLLGVTSPVIRIIFYVLGCILTGLSMFFVFAKYKKEKKVTFTVELVLNLIAIFLWLI